MPFLVAGRLRLLEPIGEGGTSRVHRAVDLSARTVVAAKLVPSYAARTGYAWPSGLADHPHVLPVSDVVPAPGLEVLVMPLVRGGTADRLLAEHGRLPTDFVAVLLDQLLDALAAVHRAGLVHGDVKPANLLLEATGTGRPHLRLGDFGAATRPGRCARAASAGYLAPEAESGAALQPRHDLFAAGVAAAELLSGRPPRHRDELPHGPLGRLLDDLLTDGFLGRPLDAETARKRLRIIGVPHDAPWQRRWDAPDVPDRFRRRRRRRRQRR
jgi:serine/threonine-protein kinase